MPTYKVTDPTTGKTLRLKGDSPPTEAELNDIFSKVAPSSTQTKTSSIGNTFTSLAKTFMPAATNIASDVGNVIASRLQLSTNKKLTSQEDEFAARLLKKVKEEKDPIKKVRLLDNFKRYNQEIGAQQQERIAPPKFSEDVNKGVGERALASSGEVASLLMPQAGATSRIGRVGAAALQGGASSAVRSATSLDNTPEDRVLNTFVDTIVGSLTGGAFQGVFEGIGAANSFYSNNFNPKLKEKGYDLLASTFKENQQSIKAMTKQGGEKEVAKKIITHNLPVTAKDSIKALEEYKPKFNKLVEEALTAPENKSKTIDFGELLDQVKNDISSQLDSIETKDQFNQAMEYLKQAKKKYKSGNLVEANKLRVRLDKITGDRLFTDVKGKEKAIKIFTGYLRNAVKNQAPETVPMFDRYALLSILPKIYLKDPKFGIVEATGALAGGSMLGGGGGGVLGLLASLGLRSPSLKRKISKTLTSLPTFQKTTGIKTDRIVPLLSTFVNELK